MLPVLLALVPSVALPLAHHAGDAESHRWSGFHAGFNDWIPIDDPELIRLPASLRLLPHASRAAFESTKADWFLLARRVPDSGGFEAAFAADEAVLSRQGELVPIDEAYLTIRGIDTLFLECDWEKDGASMKVAGLYASSSEGELTVLWIAAAADVSSKGVLSELKSCFRGLLDSFEPSASDTYRSILNRHQVSFGLRSGRGRDALVLQPAQTVPAADRAFLDRTLAANPWLVAGVVRNWRDAEHGVSLSLQVFQRDTGLGPQDPFVVWLASQLQLFVRGDEADGDVPVELIHLEGARTWVVTEEELDWHYANNKRAPDAGVILRTFVPASPFARACRLRFHDPGDPRPSLALFVELRDYARNKGETVTRTSVVLLLARAPEAARLRELEESLGFRSEPLTEAPPLADLPR